MFGTSKHLIACAVLIALAAPQARAQFDASPYCALVRENYNIADPEACNSYFTCTNGVATKKTCGTNLYYNKNTQTCTSSSLVCSQNSDPCAGTVGQTYRPVENDCQSFIYCVDGKYAGSNVCPEKMNFVNGRCTYASCPNTGSTSLNSLCQIMPENQYFGSFDDCTEYQICKTGDAQPTVGNCKAPYAFDVKISKCNFATDTKCDGRSGAPSAPPTETCTAGSPPQGDKAVCSVYYTCESEKWVKNTCPIGQYFDLRSSTCKGRQLALPYYSCDRCAGTKATFVNSVDPECNGYLYCVDSIKKSNSTCADDKFFNEDLGACVGTTNLSTYQQTNGACYPDCVCELNADSVCADKYFRPQCCTDAAECDGTTGPVDPNTTVDPNPEPEPEPETTVDPLAP